MKRLLEKLEKTSKSKAMTVACCLCPNILRWPQDSKSHDALKSHLIVCLKFDDEPLAMTLRINPGENYELDIPRRTLQFADKDVGISIDITDNIVPKNRDCNIGRAIIWKIQEANI